jgi:hypothetical protein
MSVEAFIPKNFRAKSLDMIQKANKIIRKYQAQGFTLTLRQLYYQFVAHDLFVDKYSWNGRKWVKDPEGTINAQPNYDNLGAVISDARLAGLVDWNAIEDRTRFLRGHTTYVDPADAIAKLHDRYRIDMWQNQPKRLEVWIEKDALVGVIEDICGEWDMNYFACRGYASQSELYTAGKRIEYRRQEHDQDTIVIHLGDHDPSGMDMTRDNCDRLSLFAGGYVEVRRIALNMPQVEQYNPPPNPTKGGDSRSPQYEAEFGQECWELDALEPSAISDLIRAEVDRERDVDLWNERVDLWNEHKSKLKDAVKFVDDNEEA